jgi:hypothetical protein
MIDLNNLPPPKSTLDRRRSVRGKSICACCFNVVNGQMDYPSAKDCQDFFGGELEAGDAICFWCIEDWVRDFDEHAVHGHG